MKLEDNLLFGFKSTVTDEQFNFLKLIVAPTEEVQIIFVDAGAGMGKTLISTMGAKLRGRNLRYIVAPVQEGAQGFLPGDLIEKSKPYLTPIEQALVKLKEKPKDAIFDTRLNEFMNHKAWVFAHPHTFERGVNYENETVVIDEAQNFTKHELRKLITRCNDNCKIIIIGNLKQCDLKDPSESGLLPYFNYSQGQDWIKHVELTKNFRGRVAQWADAID
jgi:predicted ribonuclease YlaK